MSGPQTSLGWRRDHQSRGIWATQPAARGADGPASKQLAFTLIEVLLALALLAALLAALNQFVFAITEAWTKNRDQFVFVQHARAVTRHVDGMLQIAANQARASNTATGAPAMSEMRVASGSTAELLTFDLPNGDRLFKWPSRPLPEVRCALAVRPDEGLVIYWKSRLEEDFATADPRVTVISPFVTALSYDYYNAETETWTNEDKPQDDATGAFPVPRRLRLRFARNGQEIEEIIPLAVSREGLPAY